MENNDQIFRQKERAVMTGFLVGFISLFPFLYIMILSNSVVLLAEAFRSGNETLACLVSWLTLRSVHRNPGKYPSLERKTGYFVAVVLCISFFIILFNARMRFVEPSRVNVTGGWLGVAAAVLSGSVNLWLWVKNRRIAGKTQSAVMESQWRLFRAKFAANCCVMTSLMVSLIFAAYPAVIYVDPAVSALLACFLLYSAGRIFLKSRNDE